MINQKRFCGGPGLQDTHRGDTPIKEASWPDSGPHTTCVTHIHTSSPTKINISTIEAYDYNPIYTHIYISFCK